MIESICGIYSITNLQNGRQYIGSSKNCELRWKTHKRNLISGAHNNQHLQHAWNKYGAKNFKFIILENVLNEENLLITEQLYLDIIPLKYNINPFAEKPPTFKGHGANAKIKISKALTGRKLSNETKRKISVARIGLIFSDNHKKNIGLALAGRSLSETHKKKLNHKGMLGKHHSEEAKRKISITLKGKYCGKNNPFFGKKHSLETRKKMSENHADFSGKNHPGWKHGKFVRK